jgi:dethiobiotin synthetase
MKNKGFFIAGTDTGIGKTVATGILAGYFSGKGLSVITQKWVQTGGCEDNDDITRHQEAMGAAKDRFTGFSRHVMRYSFALSASPHLAAAVEGKKISSSEIRKSFLSLAEAFDVVLVEGTGGLLVPLNERELIIDVVKSLELEVILVVGNRLGAINHALLSAEALKSRKIKTAGMIFNRFIPGGNEIILNDNRRIIERFSGLKDLGEIFYQPYDDRRKVVFSEDGELALKASISSIKRGENE